MTHATDEPAAEPDRIPTSTWLSIIPPIIAVQGLVLLAMGRSPICPCGTVKLWHGDIWSAENSQHIFDWYSFTHVLHGIWLYLFLWLVLRHAPVAARLVLAVLLEATWEVVENSNLVIERFRTATISLDYFGDSIVNSIFDVVAMMIGFAIARFQPVWTAVLTVIGVEIALAVLIRDNLFLNILMLIYPFEGIKAWQAALPH